MHGIEKYWHKRIVRAGENTLFPYWTIQPDDILFFDLGPVFEDWEADFGRTYVLGSDPLKLRLKNDIERAWNLGKKYFDEHSDVRGAELYGYVCSVAAEWGWSYGQEHAGHLIGNFPHELIQGDETENYIHPDNLVSLRSPDKEGRPRDWILEIHFIDQERKIGGFFEQLLTV